MSWRASGSRTRWPPPLPCSIRTWSSWAAGSDTAWICCSVRCRENLRALTPLRPKIVPSALGEDAVLLGAVATALGTARDLVFERRSAS
ncbi:hypothetical protein ACRAWF_02725 [Streptomyces sp. L7]